MGDNMRNFVTIGMTLAGIWTALSGFQQLTPLASGSVVHHLAPAILLVIFMGMHVWLNWKAFLLRFKGLGWKWGLVGIGLAIIFLTTVGDHL
jgi:hypothetical protein